MILTRRGFLKGIVPATVAVPLIAEEMLHPGRVFFLPPWRPQFRNLTITWDPSTDLVKVQDVVREALARHVARDLDKVILETWSKGSASFELEYKRAQALRDFERESVGLRWLNRIIASEWAG